jgi:hypothetical protein
MLCALPLDEARAAEIARRVAPSRTDPGALEAALKAALEAHPPPEGADDVRPDVIEHAARRARRLGVRDKARAAVAAALDRGDEAAANEAFRKAYRELFLDRMAVLWNADAKGDKVIDFIARTVPPGFDARLMGSQNIKGTGLDFVYRWLSIDRVRLALARLVGDPAARREVLTWLLSYTDFGLIDCREALAALRAIHAGDPGWSEHMGLLDSAIQRLTALDRDKTTALTAIVKAGAGEKILGRLEQIVDHLDSVRRTRWADAVMRDLFAQRVGHGRAALLLREIVARQKGGWLSKDLSAWADRWRARWRRWSRSGLTRDIKPL